MPAFGSPGARRTPSVRRKGVKNPKMNHHGELRGALRARGPNFCSDRRSCIRHRLFTRSSIGIAAAPGQSDEAPAPWTRRSVTAREAARDRGRGDGRADGPDTPATDSPRYCDRSRPNLAFPPARGHTGRSGHPFQEFPDGVFRPSHAPAVRAYIHTPCDESASAVPRLMTTRLPPNPVICRCPLRWLLKRF